MRSYEHSATREFSPRQILQTAKASGQEQSPEAEAETAGRANLPASIPKAISPSRMTQPVTSPRRVVFQFIERHPTYDGLIGRS